MSYPSEKKLFIGNIKSLNIGILMNTVKLIDRFALFYPDANKKFGFLHISSPELCNEIYEKLLNSMYNGRSIMVERPKGYVEPRVIKPPVIYTPINTSVKSNSNAWSKMEAKINPDEVRRIEIESRQKMLHARQMAIQEAERIKAIADAELARSIAYDQAQAYARDQARIQAQAQILAQAHERIKARAEAEAAQIAYNLEIDRMIEETNSREDAYVDSFFAVTPKHKVILNPEEDCY